MSALTTRTLKVSLAEAVTFTPVNGKCVVAAVLMGLPVGSRTVDVDKVKEAIYLLQRVLSDISQEALTEAAKQQARAA